MTDLPQIINQIRTQRIQRIVVLVGAGISTAAGIPDFRTPGSGLYDQLQPLRHLLPYPEALFSLSYFKHTPEPFYAIARARHPRTLRPTRTHAFLLLLSRKNLLHFLFTQNVDGLEAEVGIPADKTLNVHGSWRAGQRCWKCGTACPDSKMREAVRTGAVPYCSVAECEGGVVKPDVVFFGEEIPPEYAEREAVVREADLMLVLGTSLKVAPCSQLPRLVREGVPRVLVNREAAGDLGKRPGDVCVLGDCDDGVCGLAEALGWGGELEEVWMDAVRRVEVQSEQEDWGEEVSLEVLVEQYARSVADARLVLGGHRRMLESHLGEKLANIRGRG
ncbi:DHS-like NAD/FAD-binding domain-containing protein [Aspergillus aculeatinus CBS 121060]|uniref:DHS-like NAD/FAD-binding domain-containing protein n=1 Tax=Aspergillus aculeatinus CBS 121060 TaxID=1448322 RepID=A0ACD1HFP6_9EURO|nr:DHS-like NAD/FAD-binding domain-containing protein [Aspergillus aculeatinus CBS 121060]RAH72250.1 DHS-like NAD/FAD-binding domain-containing protein [Aspergillus aculeatinus CBS 121060]